MKEYKKVNKDQLLLLAEDASIGIFTAKQLCEKYNITKSKLYYIFKKYKIDYKLIRDFSFITNDYRRRISEKIKGTTRSNETRDKYRKVASEREYKNNRPPGWIHTELSKEKIKSSNINTYKNEKPVKWIKACIDNPAWYDKLKEAAKHKPAHTEDQIKKWLRQKWECHTTYGL